MTAPLLKLPADTLHDPFIVPQYLQLNDAIERYTADVVAADPDAFRIGDADLRYVVERRLFFALFSNREWHEYFVALKTGRTVPPDHELSSWPRLLAPYLRNERQQCEPSPSPWRQLLRYIYRRKGQSAVAFGAEYGGERRVLFLILQPKFITYLQPIAEALHVPHAYLAIDNPTIFERLAALGLPRIHIETSPQSLRLSHPHLKRRFFKHTPGIFDDIPLRLNAIRRALERIHPHSVVVPEGNADIYELVNQAAKTIGIPTLCLQQGWAPIVHPGFRNMSFTNMCVWGTGFADLLAPYNPRQRFTATGSHMVSKKLQGDPAARTSIAFFLQNGAHMMTSTAWQSMLGLIAWSAAEFPELEVRVREHPGSELSEDDLAVFAGRQNIRHMSPKTVSLSETLDGARVAIAMNSTTILEAAAMGVVPLILDVNGFGHYHPNIAAEGAALEVKDFSEAKSHLTKLVKDDAYCRSLATALEIVGNRYFAQSKNAAVTAIVNEIERSPA